MIKNIFGVTELGKKIVIGKYDDGFNPVGGRIFYIDSTSTATYKFYDVNKQEISSVAVGDSPYYYKKLTDGNEKDKYYIVDTEHLALSKCWGYVYIETDASGIYIGTGKSNTLSTLAVEDTSTDYSSESIFSYLTNTQNAGTGVNNCNDWYIGSQYELDALKDSNLVGWFNSNNIWNSQNSNTSNSMSWSYSAKRWYATSKWDTRDCCFIRSM